MGEWRLLALSGVGMALSLQLVETLAPDQSSLKSASKLRKGSQWPLLARNDGSGLIWGECQGSGANPYRVIVDCGDHGHKCTCPSRKFPCKHVLALMWLFAEAENGFTEAETPDWVTDWLGRRRKSSATPANRPPNSKNLSAASLDDPEKPADPKAAARAEAVARKRAAETRALIETGLLDLEQWIGDQLRLGVGALLKDLSPRCRTIGARLVDAKAAALAGRVDDMPTRVLSLPRAERGDAVLRELGKMVLLSRAWRADPQAPHVARAVGPSVNRETVLNNPEALRVVGVWEVLAERVSTGRDGLVTQATWLLNIASDAVDPRFALLLDYFPVSLGKRGGSFTSGERFAAELAFYPGPQPLRALIASRGDPDPSLASAAWPQGVDALAAVRRWLDLEPWALRLPLLLPPGRLCMSGDKAYWLASDGAVALPVAQKPEDFALGDDFTSTAGLWTGARLDLLAAETRAWGRVAFDV